MSDSDFIRFEDGKSLTEESSWLDDDEEDDGDVSTSSPSFLLLEWLKVLWSSASFLIISCFIRFTSASFTGFNRKSSAPSFKHLKNREDKSLSLLYHRVDKIWSTLYCYTFTESLTVLYELRCSQMTWSLQVFLWM